MIIRWAEKSDLQSLVDIFNYEVLNVTASFSIRPRSLEERTVWFEQHDRGRFPLIVAEEDKRAVGYASLSVYRDNDAYAATVELSVYVALREKSAASSAAGSMRHFISLTFNGI